MFLFHTPHLVATVSYGEDDGEDKKYDKDATEDGDNNLFTHQNFFANSNRVLAGLMIAICIALVPKNSNLTGVSFIVIWAAALTRSCAGTKTTTMRAKR